MNGGYVMIDWKGNVIPNSPEVSIEINGIYKKLEEAIKSNKPVFVYNVDIAGSINTPSNVILSKEGTSIFIDDFYRNSVEVSNDDVIKGVS